MGCVTFSELERVGLLMGSVGDNYRCRLRGRVDVGAYAPDWLGYQICTKEHNGCLNKVRDGYTAPEILGGFFKACTSQLSFNANSRSRESSSILHTLTDSPVVHLNSL